MTPTLDLDTLILQSGGHQSPEQGMCVMEAVAYIANEPFSDHPACASPVITSFLISWNDSLPDEDRQILKPYIPRIIGTRTTKADETTRAWLATDWLARECAPAFLRLAGLTEHAVLLEQLAPLTDAASARQAQKTLDEAHAAGDAAGAAAWAAAWDAAGAAAGAAAWAAAGDAAGAAAWAAAWDAAGAAAGAAAWAAAWAAAGAAAWAAAGAAAWAAAGDAAGDAARDAAGAALEPTVKTLQSSALLLLDRMIEVGKVAA